MKSKLPGQGIMHDGAEIVCFSRIGSVRNGENSKSEKNEEEERENDESSED